MGQGWGKEDVYAKDLKTNGPVKPIVTGFHSANTPYIAADELYLLTDRSAPKMRIDAYDMKNLAAGSHVVIPSGPDPIEDMVLTGGRLFVSRLHNVATRITEYTPEGKKIKDLALPRNGNATLPTGEWDSKLGFYTYESYTCPETVYSFDISAGKSTMWHQTVLPAYDTTRLTTKQVWYTSRDGTKAPMVLVYEKNLKFDGKRPTLMTGYGGFQDCELPSFNPEAAILAQAGGVFVDVTLRGGGEFGEGWHRAGMLDKKQRVFDDFIAAAEWLEKNGLQTLPSWRFRAARTVVCSLQRP